MGGGAEVERLHLHLPRQRRPLEVLGQLATRGGGPVRLRVEVGTPAGQLRENRRRLLRRRRLISSRASAVSLLIYYTFSFGHDSFIEMCNNFLNENA